MVTAAVLEQKAGEGGGDQAVLIPLGVGPKKVAHALEQHFRDLGLEADAAAPSGGAVMGEIHWVRHGSRLAVPVRHRASYGVKGHPAAPTPVARR
jgi:hypothetical protein